jgi:hypothetical protein
MKPDIYTKAVLTVIAIMLTVVACNQYIEPKTAAQAQGPLAGVQYLGHGEFYDTRTNQIWNYNLDPSNGKDGGRVGWDWKLVRLGQPMVIEGYTGKVLDPDTLQEMQRR